MPNITVAHTWAVNNPTGWSGTLRADRVYQFSINVDDDGGGFFVTASISRMITKDGRPYIIPSIIYTEGTKDFYLPTEADGFFADMLADVTEMYAFREYADAKHRSLSKDPYVFNLLKRGQALAIKVDPEHFVGISVVRPDTSRVTYYGKICGFNSEKNLVTMNTLFGGRGYYAIRKTTIKADNIRGIYSYNMCVLPYDEGVQLAAERAEEWKKRHEGAVDAQANVSEPETETNVDAEPAANVEDTSTDDTKTTGVIPMSKLAPGDY